MLLCFSREGRYTVAIGKGYIVAFCNRDGKVKVAIALVYVAILKKKLHWGTQK